AQQEEVGAAAEELPGQALGRGAAHGVVGAAEAQHRHRRLVGVAQGLVALPVALPAGGAAPSPAEEGFLQLPQRAAAQEPVHVHHLGQGPRWRVIGMPLGAGGYRRAAVWVPPACVPMLRLLDSLALHAGK
uniref:Uncharacterized protein n=1 Tax=Cyanoderma ruficeps TaxID=181631 RepID=A0A8C3QI25_9PASS